MISFSTCGQLKCKQILTYLIMKYMFHCSLRKDIGYLPYRMILMPFFKKAKLKVNEKIQVLMPNATTMITVFNLHKMHLTLRDDGHWVRASIAPPPPLIPLTIGKGSTTKTSAWPPNIIVSQSHALLLEEMCSLHLHLTNKLTAQSKHIDTISSDMLAFKANMERDFCSFHDQF